MTKKALSPIFFLLCQLLVVATAAPDVYVHKDKDGVLTFTNVPNHSGFRRVFRESISPLPGQTYTSNFEDFIISASARHSIDPDLIRAVIKTESDFNSNARSPKGAMGLMQLMPDTARQHNVLDAYDPLDNIEGGVRHLRLLLSRYRGNLELSLAAYNAGINAVERHGGIPPYAETRQYVRRVLRFYDGYRETGLQNVRQVQQ
ncbi:MAG TPA: lytic transglycosylase domain-containing protein [Gammaproteobacteria bacterium]|nr:lytic transglycosylase domain-containing protein [Gammaproteobacteria bacterium]